MSDYVKMLEDRTAQVTQPRKEAIAAAKWWGQQLRHRQPSSAGDGMVDAVARLAIGLAGKTFEYPPQTYDTFENELAASVEAMIQVQIEDSIKAEIQDDGEWHVLVGVDYDPDWALTRAATAAGIKPCGTFVFPIKTRMWIDRGAIRASKGYREKECIVWASPEGARHLTSKWMLDVAGKLNELAEAPGHDIGEFLGKLAAHLSTLSGQRKNK